MSKGYTIETLWGCRNACTLRNGLESQVDAIREAAEELAEVAKRRDNVKREWNVAPRYESLLDLPIRDVVNSLFD